jgi:Fibrobacter succinogenes major domain (Fib_succ_major).
MMLLPVKILMEHFTNWYVLDAASNGSKNVCPKGWHAPSDAEWTTLTLLARSSGG